MNVVQVGWCVTNAHLCAPTSFFQDRFIAPTVPVVTQHHSDDATTLAKEREHLMHHSYNSPTFNDPINVEFHDEDESFIAPIEVEMPPSKFEAYMKGSLQMQPPSFKFSSLESCKYHEHEHVGDASGNCYLVGCSQFQSSVMQAAELDVEEVYYHISLTTLVSSMSHGDRMLFSQILPAMVQIVKKQMLWDDSTGHKLTAIPTTALHI